MLPHDVKGRMHISDRLPIYSPLRAIVRHFSAGISTASAR
ncbi:hypothetical protein CSC04_2222 [Enterobacter roggenkampii]|nr:hypothetical protein CSC04_2222 [Enterobacter roggenkampii]